LHKKERNEIIWLKGRNVELRGFRRRFERGRCPPWVEKEYVKLTDYY
jgi:hypothetical protein